MTGGVPRPKSSQSRKTLAWSNLGRLRGKGVEVALARGAKGVGSLG